jgi:quinol monooxygenase YgiN
MMIISITTSRPTQDQVPKVEDFLKSFLPKTRKFPGVIAIYRYARPDKYDDSTIVIWES